MRRCDINRFQIARARSDIYSFLAVLFAVEPDLTLLRRIRKPDFIQNLSELGIEFEKDLSEKGEREILDEMIQEYTRLFIGPGKHVSPHESVHREKEGLLWGDSTGRVKTFIESSGLKYRSDFKGIPDHISVELEFMHRLVKAEEEARRKDDPARLEKILDMEKRFVGEHLSRWIPRFTDRVVEAARVDFYRKIATVTKEFILYETEELNKPS